MYKIFKYTYNKFKFATSNSQLIIRGITNVISRVILIIDSGKTTSSFPACIDRGEQRNTCLGSQLLSTRVNVAVKTTNKRGVKYKRAQWSVEK